MAKFLNRTQRIMQMAVMLPPLESDNSSSDDEEQILSKYGNKQYVEEKETTDFENIITDVNDGKFHFKSLFFLVYYFYSCRQCDNGRGN